MSTLYSIGQMNQLGDALEASGYTAEDVTKLRSSPFLKSILDVVYGRAKIVLDSSILDLKNSNFFIPEIKDPFVVLERFVINTKEGAKPKISYIGDNFKEWFYGQFVAPRSAYSMKSAVLKKGSQDKPILDELGQGAETDLAAIFELMVQQSNDQKNGKLLTNGYSNIFYVYDTKGLLRAVSVYWCGGGWNVNAGSVSDPRGWSAGRCVLSRNS